MRHAFAMDEWIAEYSRGRLLFNVEAFFAPSKEDAECAAWQHYMHLADCIQVEVYRLVTAPQNTTTLSERSNLAGEKKRGKGMRRMAA